MSALELGKILIYQNEKGDTKLDVYFGDDDVWLSQKNLAKLYQTSPQNITMHIKKQLAEQQYELFDSHRKMQEANLDLLEEETLSIKAVKRD